MHKPRQAGTRVGTCGVCHFIAADTRDVELQVRWGNMEKEKGRGECRSKIPTSNRPTDVRHLFHHRPYRMSTSRAAEKSPPKPPSVSLIEVHRWKPRFEHEHRVAWSIKQAYASQTRKAISTTIRQRCCPTSCQREKTPVRIVARFRLVLSYRYA